MPLASAAEARALLFLLLLTSATNAAFYPGLVDDLNFENVDYGGDANGHGDDELQDIVSRMADYIDWESLAAQPDADDPVIAGASLRDSEDIHHSHLFGSNIGDNFQSMQGGAGEGRQWLKPEGTVLNKQEVKTDRFLPAYCDPPNPCPVGYTSEDGCDPAPGSKFTASYSKIYQASQDCHCDVEHNYECPEQSRMEKNPEEIMSENLKNLALMMAGEGKGEEGEKDLGPRDQKRSNGSAKTKTEEIPQNPFLAGAPLKRVAKKSPTFFEM